jgi:cytochrome b involved in lipid metabolism
MEDEEDTCTHLGVGQRETGDLGLILKELKEFRKDNSQQLKVVVVVVVVVVVDIFISVHQSTAHTVNKEKK